MQVEGVLPRQPVTVVAVDWHSPMALTLTYRDPSSMLDEVILGRDAELRLSVTAPKARWSFAANGAEFRLAAEVQLATLSDPMLAVSTSDLEPLPHQIRAVYEEMPPLPAALPRLADRRVLEAGVAQTLNEPLGWEHSIFALAAGDNGSARRYADVCPVTLHRSPLPAPRSWCSQQPRSRNGQSTEADRIDTVPPGPPLGPTPGTGPGPTQPDPTTPPAPERAPETRTFGAPRLDPQKYGKDFAVVVDEVLQRLSAAGAQLEVWAGDLRDSSEATTSRHGLRERGHAALRAVWFRD